ncbi:MAG: DsbA family protein [Rhodoferax sp.]|nr:DsbA family protein [Rhodoferax sp.]
MSIASWLMPAISQRLLARDRLLKQRARLERKRAARGERHQVLYFHQVDDPYSALTANILEALLARYDVDLVAHVVGPPSDSAAPERERLVAYSRVDAERLARHHGLAFSDPGAQPSAQRVSALTAQLVGACQARRFHEFSGLLCKGLWRDESVVPQGLQSTLPTPATPAEVDAHLAAANALRQRLGHYLGATFYYGGEWYWGIDRLHHLERRLQALGVARPGVQGLMFAPDQDLRDAVPIIHPEPIEFFFSLRSPYSAIVAERVFKLGQLTGAPVRLRYVLPMVMRGLSVPRIKRMYIALDAAREAFERGIPFGRLNDPVGRPTERGLALIPYAERMGEGQRYVLSFLRGVWSEGLDAGSDRGLRTIVERAGLSWPEARHALKEDGWRRVAEENRVAMLDLGLWGVPSFRVGSTAVWGQDRLWAAQEALLSTSAPLESTES